MNLYSIRFRTIETEDIPGVSGNLNNKSKLDFQN